MLRQLIRTWWSINLQGVLAIAFGLAAVFLAGTVRELITGTLAIVTVLLLFALYLIASGVLSIVAFIRESRQAPWWALFAHAFLLLAFGSWIFVCTHVTIVWLLYFAVAHSLLIGVSEVVLTFDLKRHITDEIVVIAAAAFSLLAGTLLFLARNASVDVTVGAIGFYAIFFGSMLVIFSLRLHALRTRQHQIPHLIDRTDNKI
jgi:uncharacterized membrane protein HdeD (DUF308 family)